MKRASTDTSRKIRTLRNWGMRGVKNQEYLIEIGDEMERIYLLMIDARKRLMLIERYPNNRRVLILAKLPVIK